MAEAQTRPTSIGVKEFIDGVEPEKKREAHDQTAFSAAGAAIQYL